jgi:diguanylate cyclase
LRLPIIGRLFLSRRPEAWLVYLGLGLLALFVYFLLPNPAIQLVYFCGFCMSAVVAICVAIRVHRPARTRSWLMLAAGLGTINLGNIFWAWLTISTGVIPFPSIADAAFLAGYVLVGASLLSLFRGRVPGGDTNGVIDALIVTVGLGMVSWVFFMHPNLHDTNLLSVGTLVAVAYPLVDVLLFGVAARLFLIAGPRPTGFRLLALALGANILADVVNATLSLSPNYQGSDLVFAGWAIGFLAFGAFALHSTARAVEGRTGASIGTLRSSRVVLLAAATLMAPLVMVIEAARGEAVDVVVVAPASVVLFLLVLSRLVTVVRDLRATLGEREALETQLTFQALHDPLTGLANRRLFTERLAETISAQRDTGVIFLDLDDFKTINDTRGHPAGDEVLRAVADRLRVCIRSTDMPARLGGDEFGVLLIDCHSAESAARTAERLISAMASPLLVDGRTIQIGMSIGVALAVGGDLSVSDIMRNADIAMYMAKGQGKGRYELYRSEMGTHIIDRGLARDDLEAGIARGEVEPQYQPIVDLATGDILAIEALARWRHPRRGLVMPAEFIPLAEATGLIMPLGAAILNRAIAEVIGWPDGPRGPLALHVNLSVHQLRAPGLAPLVDQALRSSAFDASRLVLEITESSLLGDHETSVLNDLKRLGVRLAIDDFGTGFSSLGYLRQLPVDMIKIDRSFVSALAIDSRDAEIVRGVLRLAEGLQLEVVAEGIEDELQRVRLVGLGCTSGQGFLFSPALPEKVMRILIEKRSAARGQALPARGPAVDAAERPEPVLVPDRAA